MMWQSVSFLLSSSLLFQANGVLGFTTSTSKNGLAFSTRSSFTLPKSSNEVAQPNFNNCYWAPQQKHAGVLYMGWGPEPTWTAAKVASSMTCSPSGQFVQVTVDVPAEVIDEYKVPGQYVQLKQSDSEDAKPIFLAIASPPKKGDDAANKMEFLIKKTDNNAWITSAPDASELYISQVMGAGFKIQENFEGYKFDFPCQNVLLFANGSGIAPIRAAIESSQLNIATPGKGGRTARLYYGVQSPDEMPYADKFKEWEMCGVEVVPVVSRPEECDWNGRSGYVQNALEEDGVPIPRNTGALLCGVKGMAESVKDLLCRAGKILYVFLRHCQTY